ncbi:MAG: TetR/AcrR family transcriptional regulator [Actinomycetota bacterium]
MTEITDGSPSTETRRERLRRELTEQIVEIGRRQLEAGGVSAVSWRAIAREVGMNPASLYTYVDGVDDLYTRILLQSFKRFGDAVHEAMAEDGRPPRDRLVAGARAFRAWALAHPSEFNLLYTDQLPDYEAPPDGPTVEAQRQAIIPFAQAIAQLVGEPEPMRLVSAADDERTRLVFTMRAVMHGYTTLEVNNHAPYLDGTGDEMIEALERVLDDLVAVARAKGDDKAAS